MAQTLAGWVTLGVLSGDMAYMGPVWATLADALLSAHSPEVGIVFVIFIFVLIAVAIVIIVIGRQRLLRGAALSQPFRWY